MMKKTARNITQKFASESAFLGGQEDEGKTGLKLNGKKLDGGGDKQKSEN